MGKCEGCPYKTCIGPINCNDPCRGEVVERYFLPSGTEVVIMDGAYRNKTPEQLKMVWQGVVDAHMAVANRIARDEPRKQNALNASGE